MSASFVSPQACSPIGSPPIAMRETVKSVFFSCMYSIYFPLIVATTRLSTAPIVIKNIFTSVRNETSAT